MYDMRATYVEDLIVTGTPFVGKMSNISETFQEHVYIDVGRQAVWYICVQALTFSGA